MHVIFGVFSFALVAAIIDHFTGRRLSRLKAWQIFLGLWVIYGLIKLISMAFHS